MGSFPFWWTASTCGSFNSCTVCLLVGREEDGCSSLQRGACRLWRGNWRRGRRPRLASCWACGVQLKTVDFVYPSPQWVMVEKGLYQNHGQPYVHIHADFLDLLLKRRYLLYIFLLLSSPKLLLNTVSRYLVLPWRERTVLFSSSNWEGREQYQPPSSQLLKAITSQHFIVTYSGLVQAKQAIKAL